MEKTLEITNEEGIHARPAGIFSKQANQYQSNIEIEFNGSSINAKSVMTLMSLGLTKGAIITLKTNGIDEEKALNELSQLIENKFQQ